MNGERSSFRYYQLAMARALRDAGFKDVTWNSTGFQLFIMAKMLDNVSDSDEVLPRA